MRMIVAATAFIGLTAFAAEAAPAGGSDSDSAYMVQPSTDMAKTQDKTTDDARKKDDKKAETDASKTPDDGAPTAAQPNVMPQDQDKQPTQPAPGQEPSPNPGRPHS